MQAFLNANSGIVSRIGYTLDFKEYLNFAKKNTEERSLTLEDNFRNYLKYGGLPEIHNLHFKEDSISNIWMLSITQLFLKIQ